MFCLTQLAGIAGGVMLAHKARKFYALWKSMGEDELQIPIAFELFARHGWLLIVIPIACVLLIPRHREEDSEDSVEWRWYSKLVVIMGAIAISVPLFTGISALIVGFEGPPRHIIHKIPAK